MALERQIRQIIFGEGIDTRVDPNVIPIGKLRKLENGVFAKPGAIKKKDGSATFGTASNDYPTVETIKSIFVYNGILYKIQKNSGGAYTLPTSFFTGTYAGNDILMSWSPTLQKWVRLTGCSSIFGRTVLDTLQAEYGASTLSLQASSTAASNCVTASVGGYLLTATWQADNTNYSNNAVIVTDINTGAVVYRRVSGTVGYMKAVVFNGLIYLFSSGSVNQEIHYEVFDPTTITLTYNGTALVNNLGNGANQTNNLFDVCVFGSTVFLAYRTSTPNITINSYTSLPTSGAAAVINTATIAETAINFLSVGAVTIGGNNRVIVVWRSDSGASNRIRAATYSTALGAVTAPTTIDTMLTATSSFQQGAPVHNSTFTPAGGAECYCIVASQMYTGFSNSLVCTTYLVNAALGFVSTGTASNQSMASKPFVYSGQAYFFAVAETDNYSSLILNYIDTTRTGGQVCKPVVKLFNGDGMRSLLLAGTGSVAAQLNAINEPVVVGTKAYFGTLKEFGDFNGTVQYYPNAVEIDFDHPNKYQNKKLGDLLYFNGGVPFCFDGKVFREVNFLIAPRKPVLTAGTTGSLTPSSTYQVIIVRKRIDAFGRVHYSEPSLPTSVTLGAGDDSITVTPSENDNWGVTWDSYTSTLYFRTEANGTVFYLDREVAVSGFLAQSLTQADSTLIAREILYTEGGILPNESATSCTSIAVFKERLFALTSEGLMHTKQVTEGQPAAFSSFFQIATVQGQRWPTAISTLLDKLLIKFNDSIFFISGDGANDTGDLGSFSAPQLINAGFGCINAASVLEKESEVWFQSEKGWSKINADLSIEMVGSELDYFIDNSSQCYSMMYSDRLHQVRICDGNRTYVWDTDIKQWSVFTTYNDTKQIEWNGQVIRLNGGVLYYEDPASGKDGSSFVSTLIGTGQIHLNNIQGFQRVYNAFIFGRWRAPHSIRVDVYYDGVPKVAETHLIDLSPLSVANYTDANVYANNSYAGSATPYELRIQLGRQQCQTIAFDIYDTAQAGTGQSGDLIGLNIEIGLKKQRPNLRVGAGAQA